MIDRESLEMIAEIIDQKLEENNTKLEAKIDQKLDRLEERLEKRISCTEANLQTSIDELGDRITRTEHGLLDVTLSVAELNRRSSLAENRLRNLTLRIEHIVEPQIKLLAESYVPTAKRMEEAAASIEPMQASIDILNYVVANHSEQLKQII